MCCVDHENNLSELQSLPLEHFSHCFLSEGKDSNDQFLHPLVQAPCTLNLCMMSLCYKSTRSYVIK